MGWIYVAGLFLLLGLLCGGGYVRQRDKYWKRVWEELGKPDVHSIKELKQYIKNIKKQNS